MESHAKICTNEHCWQLQMTKFRCVCGIPYPVSCLSQDPKRHRSQSQKCNQNPSLLSHSSPFPLCSFHIPTLRQPLALSTNIPTLIPTPPGPFGLSLQTNRIDVT